MKHSEISKTSFIVFSIILSGLLGFGIQKLLVTLLTLEQYARYDLLLSLVFIFNGMLTVNFINYYKRRVSKTKLLVKNGVTPFQFIVFIVNLHVVSATIFIVSFVYQIDFIVSVALIGLHLLIMGYEFKKVELNIGGLYKTYSWYLLVQSLAYIVILTVVYLSSFLQEYFNENTAIILFCLANLFVFIKINPRVYRVSIKRITTFFVVGWKFMLPLFIYAILSWLNDNLGKYYLVLNDISLSTIGGYIGVSGLVLKVIFTLSAGFDYLVTERLFKKKVNYKAIKQLFLAFFAFGGVAIIGLYLFAELGVRLFLNENYMSSVHLVLPLGISALLIKYIHLIESFFIRLGTTSFILMGYSLLMITYFAIVLISNEITPELMCYSQLISCVLTAIFVTVALIITKRKRGWSS